MKKIKFAIIFLMGLVAQVFCQMQDLSNLASGDIVMFHALFDEEDEMYGYFSLFDHGKLNDETRSFEYVILDKNLNIAATKTFEAENHVGTYYSYLDFKNDLILVPQLGREAYNLGGRVKKNLKQPENKIINLKENTINKKFDWCFENGEFVDCVGETFREEAKDEMKERREKGFVRHSTMVEYKYGGYLLFEADDYISYVSNNRIARFDENKNLIWDKRYNEDAGRRKSEKWKLIDWDENNAYILKQDREKRDLTFQIIVISMKNGEILSQTPVSQYDELTMAGLTNLSSEAADLTNSKVFDDKVVVISDISPDANGVQGYVRMEINKSDFSVSFDDFYWTPDVEPFVDKINKYGKVERNFTLRIRDLFILEDGSIGFLFEKFKYHYWDNYSPRTMDMLYLYTDDEFKIKDVKVFEKEANSHSFSDYLYSQYLHNEKDVAFFYKDYQKDDEGDKNWKLFINTLIDGQFNQEIIPISSEENMIYPYVAKEGYILLREFNEKEKYNMIRLEKLNY